MSSFLPLSGPNPRNTQPLADIGGMEAGAGRALLLSLLAHATQSWFAYSHAWRQGDLVLWDKCCLVHRALPHANMAQHRRVLHRTVVKGSVPIGP